MFIATLIAADRLERGDISAARDALSSAGMKVAGESWIEAGSACDLRFSGDVEAAKAALERLIPFADHVVQAEANRRKRLLIADMDSTMITVECIDELADYAGVRAEVAEVTEQAMRGELDFEAALEARLRLLKGLEKTAIARCHDERVRISPGAKVLVATMRAHGAYAVLVSGGFSLFAVRVSKEIGFDKAVSNELLIESGRLSGAVRKPVVGAEAKRQTLISAALAKGIDLADTLAIGDGANDIPMIQAAGLGVAYRAKPAVAAAAAARIEHNDLSALLFAQGFARKDWVTP